MSPSASKSTSRQGKRQKLNAPEGAPANSAVAGKPSIRTSRSWELFPLSGEPPKNDPWAFWIGVELVAATYFVAECFFEDDGVASSVAFISGDIGLAERYLELHPSAIASRILVRIGESTYTTGDKKLEELDEVLRCKKSGALLYCLSSGEVVSDGVEPATDLNGIQRFDVIYPTPPAAGPRTEVRRIWPRFAGQV